MMMPKLKRTTDQARDIYWYVLRRLEVAAPLARPPEAASKGCREEQYISSFPPLKRVPEEWEHAAAVHDGDEADQREGANRTLANVRDSSGLRLPRGRPDGQVQQIRGGEHQEDQLPVEHHVRGIALWRGEIEHHPADLVDAEAEQRPRQQAMQRRIGNGGEPSHQAQVGEQEDAEPQRHPDEMRAFKRRPHPLVTGSVDE